MTHSSSHCYCPSQRPIDLQKFSRAAVDFILEDDHLPVLCYSGSSGIALATATMMQLHAVKPDAEFGMVYARKPDEDSHGTQRAEVMISSKVMTKPTRLYFIDDLIGSGRTFSRSMQCGIDYFTLGNQHDRHEGLPNFYLQNHRSRDMLDRTRYGLILYEEGHRLALKRYDEIPSYYPRLEWSN